MDIIMIIATVFYSMFAAVSPIYARNLVENALIDVDCLHYDELDSAEKRMAMQENIRWQRFCGDEPAWQDYTGMAAQRRNGKEVRK